MTRAVILSDNYVAQIYVGSSSAIDIWKGFQCVAWEYYAGVDSMDTVKSIARKLIKEYE